MTVSEMITVPEQSRDIVDAKGRSGAVCAIPRSICASLRRDDGVHYETRGNGTAPAGVAALGAADAGNGGPVGVAEAAR